jgi:hypothetical protein
LAIVELLVDMLSFDTTSQADFGFEAAAVLRRKLCNGFDWAKDNESLKHCVGEKVVADLTTFSKSEMFTQAPVIFQSLVVL